MIAIANPNQLQTDGAQKKQVPKVNFYDLITVVMADAVSEQSRHALYEAKQLNQNALLQEGINNKAAELPWYHIPAEEISYQKIQKRNTYITYYPNPMGPPIRVTRYTYQTIGRKTIIKNIAVVDAARIKDNQVDMQRQTFTDKLMKLRQLAQVGATKVNGETDEVEQTMQERSGFLEMIKALIDKAAMHRPVDGG